MRARPVLALVLLPLGAAGLLAQEQLPADTRDAIDKAAQEVLARTGAPSASLAVVRDGTIVYEGAYGTADLATGTRATTRMRYSIGSISKQFTAAAVLLLAEEGRLSLDDRVVRWLPELTQAR
ncbi:MAG TPA: serine hydrolase domain-containing protein, partial [Vicinamibacteria bacterium]|nr:serine hydrolase domain-containing protein [Vicinamibacteria bacterium]